MLSHYLKAALRHYRRQPGTAALYVAGLVLGMASALLVFVVVSHETGYDRHQTNFDRIYRVETENVREGHTYPGTYTEMERALRTDVPELETIVPIWEGGKKTLSVPAVGRLFKEPVLFVGNELFSLLDYRWLGGDARTALLQPNAVVLTRSAAEKLLGTAEAVGKTIRYDAKLDLLVTGVVENYPATTNFPFSIMISFPTLKQVNPEYDRFKWDGWGDNYQVYVALKPHIRPEQVAGGLRRIVAKNFPREEIPNKRFVLNPLEKLHYAGNLSGRTASGNLLRMLVLIGAFVLLIACINFVNLTTAQALRRAREIGIRKAVGSRRRALVYQFMTEAGLVTLVSALLAAIVALLLLSPVAKMLGIPLSPADLFTTRTLVFTLGLLVVTTLSAGTYPAFRLSGLAPMRALKTNLIPHGRHTVTLRQALVVVQFAISLVLICSTLLIRRQLSFFREADLGFNKKAVITVSLPDNQPLKLQTLRNRLMQSPLIKDVSFSFNSASAESNWMQGLQYRKGAKVTEIKTQMKMVDAHYLTTYVIQLLAGEAFREGDTLPKAIANQVFIKRMGIPRPQDALGRRVYYGDSQESTPIVGVVKNFHVNSLHQRIDPTLLLVAPRHFYQAGIKLENEGLTGEALQAALTSIEKAWKGTFPNQVFEYNFLDSTLARAYQNEFRTGQLIQTLALIAILIACLGLFGLAAFSAEHRTKEIGVRKVLGASVAGIVALLAKDFIKPVLIALLLATPVAWYGMNRWLREFAFRVEIEWWIFALGGGLAVIIAMLTVSYQSIKAALLNPVKSLRAD